MVPQKVLWRPLRHQKEVWKFKLLFSPRPGSERQGLMAKLSQGVMNSRDACYCYKSMTGFTNLCRRFVNDCNKKGKKIRKMQGNSFSEIFKWYRGNLDATTIVLPYLKLSDVKKYYCQFFGDWKPEFVKVNSTCLKERLIT